MIDEIKIGRTIGIVVWQKCGAPMLDPEIVPPVLQAV